MSNSNPREFVRAKIARGAALVFICFGFAAGAACAGSAERAEQAESAQHAEKTRVLRVGTSGDYPPFSEAIAEAPGFRGFDVDLAHAFARDRGYAIEWVRFRWPELAEALRAGRFDVAMSGVTVRPDRSASGRFSVPVQNSGALLLYRTGGFGGVVASDFARFDRSDVRVAVNRGGHLERVTRSLFQHARIQAIPDNAAVRQALAEGKVDAVMTDTIEAPRWRRGLDGIAQFGPLTRDRKACWTAQGRDALSRELDDWLLAREADGTLARLRSHWFGAADARGSATPWAALVAAVDERLDLMPWVAESKRASGRAIEDLAQEERVLEGAVRAVAEAARRRVTSPPAEAKVRAFYRAQIDAAKDIQRRVLAGPVTRKAAAEDLQRVLRPALARIGDRMAQLVVALARGDAAADPNKPELKASLARHALPPAQLDALEAALEALGSGAVEREDQNRASVNAAGEGR